MSNVVYRCYDAQERLLYIGVSEDWEARKRLHEKQSPWFPTVARIALESFETYEDAYNAEMIAIQRENPTHNHVRSHQHPFTAPVTRTLAEAMTHPDGYTVTEVAAELGIKPGAVRDAIAKGKIDAIRTGGNGQRAGHLLIMRDELNRYRAERLGKRGKYARPTKTSPDAS